MKLIDPYMVTSISPRETGLPWGVHAYMGYLHASDEQPFFMVTKDGNFGYPGKYVFYLDEIYASADGHIGLMWLGKETYKPFLYERDCVQIGRWRFLNKEPLLRHWNGEIDSHDLLNAIKPVKRN